MYVLALVAPIRDLAMAGSFFLVMGRHWPCSLPKSLMCLHGMSTPTMLVFMGFRYFCIAAVFHRWSKTCPEVQIFMVWDTKKPHWSHPTSGIAQSQKEVFDLEILSALLSFPVVPAEPQTVDDLTSLSIHP